MCQQFRTTLEQLTYNVVSVEKGFSRRQEEIGKPQLRKLVRSVHLLSDIRRAQQRYKPDLAIYFISVAKPALLVDIAMLRYLKHIGIPYILYFHGRGYATLAESDSLFAFLLRRVLGEAKGGIVLGERLKEDVVPFIKAHKLLTVPNAIPWTERVSRLYTNKTSLQVLFLANLEPSKGAMEYLRAAHEVLKIRQDIRFVLAGPCRDKAFETQLSTYIERAGLRNYIEMTGAVYGADKEELFARSDIFVFPTRYRYEAFSLVNLEAMRAGLPVISSDVGCIPEEVRHGISGYIVNSEKPLEIAHYIGILADSPELRQHLGEAGRSAYEETYCMAAYTANVREAISFFLMLDT
jgi:glycosyltransferase involved in cell wall biosynthesis